LLIPDAISPNTTGTSSFPSLPSRDGHPFPPSGFLFSVRNHQSFEREPPLLSTSSGGLLLRGPNPSLNHRSSVLFSLPIERRFSPFFSLVQTPRSPPQAERFWEGREPLDTLFRRRFSTSGPSLATARYDLFEPHVTVACAESSSLSRSVQLLLCFFPSVVSFRIERLRVLLFSPEEIEASNQHQVSACLFFFAASVFSVEDVVSPLERQSGPFCRGLDQSSSPNASDHFYPAQRDELREFSRNQEEWIPPLFPTTNTASHVEWQGGPHAHICPCGAALLRRPGRIASVFPK